MPETTHAPGVEQLGFETTLPTALIHKRASEQVFLCDFMPGPGDDVCTIAAELPLAHLRFSDGAAPFHDIVLIAEVVRQAGLVIADRILEVPEGWQFLLRQLRVSLDPLEANRRGPDTQKLLVSQDPSSTIKMRASGRLSGGSMRARLSIAGRPSGTCEVDGIWAPAETYDGFRGDGGSANGSQRIAPPPPEARETLTGKSTRNSVLLPLEPAAAGGFAATLVVDRDDPTFFDHALDHVPGLLLMEALQQASVAAICRDRGLDPALVAVASLEMGFSRIAEFGPDVTCTVTLDGDRGSVTCSQLGKTCCEGFVDVTVVA